MVEAGLRFRQAETAHWIEREVGNDPQRTFRERGRAAIEFMNACDVLLAIRAKQESGE